jgi:hypothetical protein
MNLGPMLPILLTIAAAHTTHYRPCKGQVLGDGTPSNAYRRGPRSGHTSSDPHDLAGKDLDTSSDPRATIQSPAHGRGTPTVSEGGKGHGPWGHRPPASQLSVGTFLGHRVVRIHRRQLSQKRKRRSREIMPVNLFRRVNRFTVYLTVRS